MIWALTIALGALVGVSLGLTGGGGAIFAVPLLVYGLGFDSRQAATMSLVTVGITSLIGLLQKAAQRQLEFKVGLLFAIAGALGSPIGVMLAAQLHETLRLALFAGLMLVIAFQMWRRASTVQLELPLAWHRTPTEQRAVTCQRDPEGILRITSPCALLLGAVGIGAGILSGMFGVGGGFIIVPALVLFSGMAMRRAVGTSLLVITIVSLTTLLLQTLDGVEIPLITTSLFSAGSIAGLLLGSGLSHLLAGPRLQKVFATMILLVVIFIITKTVLT
ncbi:protein of unknown function DUF81 [Pirellula staleyi DSM 6068]|uniref:Probable membrane transporter protein n=1 Tax=Pirellula staleyi (strain ATCC 27377 / DSM 6068 / ICPB 4128) TaxID=530564 RepID=D2R3C0_PIRSD|nr:sulfite exporter TauE/SafE family protein [Pirellula staleyi]ADB15151.1 protein of unknown function DUF81 [Pirellula staleyi DSM 6068]